jgi:phage-related protein
VHSRRRPKNYQLDRMSPIRDNGRITRRVDFHHKARTINREFSKPVRQELGEALRKVQMGMALGLPLSRPMPIVALGVHEFRLADIGGIYRVFYYTKSLTAILVFYAFIKKTRETSPSDIKLGRKRLQEMMTHEKDIP